MKKYLLCGVIVFSLMLTGFFANAAQAVEEQPMNTEITETQTEATEESVTEPATEPSTQPSNIYEGACGANTWWKIDPDTGVLTISGSGAMDDFNLTPWFRHGAIVTKIVIESGVTVICDKAFNSCGYATSVSIPSTVTKIGSKAFESCSHLTSVKLPSSITHLGDNAFSYCRSLRDINLPQSITSLGKGVFQFCQSMKTITIPSGFTEIPNAMFSGCTDMTEITIPSSVKSIGSMAFRNCSALSVVRFQGNAPDINVYAFENVKASVTYPADDSTWTADKQKGYGGDLTWIPDAGSGVQISGTFGQSNIMNWKIDSGTLYITGNGYMSGWSARENTPWYDYRGHIHKIVMSGNIENIYAGAFAGCENLTEIVWPSGVMYIFDSAFSGCSSLKRIVLPNSVKTIGSSAFHNCTALTSVTLPQSLTEIVGYAFSGCSSLQSITIPSGVRVFGERIFYGCTALKTVYFTGNIPRFSEPGMGYYGSFGNISNVTVYYPAGNGTWTAAKVKQLGENYGKVTFLPNQDGTSAQPSQPGGVDTVTDPTEPNVSTQPETGPTTGPEETIPDTTKQTDPETTDDTTEVTPKEDTIEQENTTEPEHISDTAMPEAKAEDTANQQSDQAPKGKVWVIVGVSMAVAMAGAGAVIWWKKRQIR